jgi:hypothetical protein
MRKRWVQIGTELIPADEYTAPDNCAPMVFGDLPDYESPIDGHIVSGRKARREDLKRNGCRPWEGMASEKAEAAKRMAENERKTERIIDDIARRAYYSLDPAKRRILRGE